MKDSFKMYQELREAAERDVKMRVFGWAMTDAPDTMSIDDVRVITAQMVTAVNHHTRQVYDAMLAARDKESQP